MRGNQSPRIVWSTPAPSRDADAAIGLAAVAGTVISSDGETAAFAGVGAIDFADETRDADVYPDD